jgi:hypothetical protein
MLDLTIRNNIFVNSTVQTIAIQTPQKNMKIHNNVFYNEVNAIGPHSWQKPEAENVYRFGDAPSTVSIQGNIFMNCGETIAEALTAPNPTDHVTIDGNLFFNNQGQPAGKNAIAGKDPLFRDPAKLDFRLRPDSPAIRAGADLGAYDADSPLPPNTDWWNLKDPNALGYVAPNRLPE